MPDRIFSRGFVLICCVNFLFFCAFYMLIPILPLYLLKDLDAGKAVTGILLSVYVLSALAIRPLSGHLVDAYPRKIVFTLCALGYALVFLGYLWITALVLFGLLRIVHGVAFGMINTSTTTIAADLIPSARLGTGMGIYGLAMAVPMALGPMVGSFLYANHSAMAVFHASVALAAVGAVIGMLVPASSARPAPPPRAARLLQRLFLPQAAKAGLSLLGVAFVYGIILNYISVFVEERGLTVNVGLFFCLLAVGMIISRLIAGRFIDKGKAGSIILCGTGLCFAALILITAVNGLLVLLVCALLYGLGTGLVMPAFQTLFMLMAGVEQRGLANSSFFIAWDGGIGIALFAGGFIAEISSFAALYLVGAAVLVLAAGNFLLRAAATLPAQE